MWLENSALISRARVLLLLTLVTGVTVAAACGLDKTGTGENAGEPYDASAAVDATITITEEGSVSTDSGKDTGAIVDGGDAAEAGDAEAGPMFACDDAGVTTCASCTGRPTACAATGACVAQCSSECAGARVACFRCVAGGPAVVGTCEVENDAGYCMNGAYAPGVACPCVVKDASTCPGDFQLCIDSGPGYACHSCGELLTDKQQCKSGKNCDTGGNAADHLTCH